jgi:predicted adenylyl cyclase CyaB
MSNINIEIKARTNKVDRIRQFLLDNGADYKGLDVQTDTYFNVPAGRLKLRQGNIENSLIFYNRENVSGPKQSDFDLLPMIQGEELKFILSKALGVKVAVRKHREIYYIKNVKFHLDTLDGIGQFVEIEAMNKGNDIPIERLRDQCDFYITAFEINEQDLVPISYSDILLGF